MRIFMIALFVISLAHGGTQDIGKIRTIIRLNQNGINIFVKNNPFRMRDHSSGKFLNFDETISSFVKYKPDDEIFQFTKTIEIINDIEHAYSEGKILEYMSLQHQFKEYQKVNFENKMNSTGELHSIYSNIILEYYSSITERDKNLSDFFNIFETYFIVGDNMISRSDNKEDICELLNYNIDLFNLNQDLRNSVDPFTDDRDNYIEKYINTYLENHRLLDCGAVKISKIQNKNLNLLNIELQQLYKIQLCLEKDPNSSLVEFFSHIKFEKIPDWLKTSPAFRAMNANYNKWTSSVSNTKNKISEINRIIAENKTKQGQEEIDHETQQSTVQDEYKNLVDRCAEQILIISRFKIDFLKTRIPAYLYRSTSMEQAISEKLKAKKQAKQSRFWNEVKAKIEKFYIQYIPIEEGLICSQEFDKIKSMVLD